MCDILLWVVVAVTEERLATQTGMADRRNTDKKQVRQSGGFSDMSLIHELYSLKQVFVHFFSQVSRRKTTDVNSYFPHDKDTVFIIIL